MTKKRIEYPSWHDEARAARGGEGLQLNQVADRFGVSANTATKICSASWREYLLMYRTKHTDRKGMSLAEFNPEGYEFVPVEAKAPIEKEREYHAKKRREAKYQTPLEAEPMNKSREFEIIHDVNPAIGKQAIAFKIMCCKCDKSEMQWSVKGMMPFEFVAKKFTQKGWLIGGSSRSDLCPLHAKGFRVSKPELVAPPKKEEPVMPVPAPATVTALARLPHSAPVASRLEKLFEKPVLDDTPTEEPLRVPAPVPAPPMEVMGKAEKRIIFAKLNDVYEDEKVGYSGDWSDAKVAKDLGVPVAWVKEVRDESFGPEMNADLRQKSYDDLAKLGERIDQSILLIEKKLDAMDTLDDKVAEALDAAEKAVDRLEELAGNLKTSDDQMKGLMDGFNKQVAEFKKMRAAMLLTASA